MCSLFHVNFQFLLLVKLIINTTELHYYNRRALSSGGQGVGEKFLPLSPSASPPILTVPFILELKREVPIH